MICQGCKNKTKNLEEFGNIKLCSECMEEIGIGFDRFEIGAILKRRGKKWILKEIE